MICGTYRITLFISRIRTNRYSILIHRESKGGRGFFIFLTITFSFHYLFWGIWSFTHVKLCCRLFSYQSLITGLQTGYQQICKSWDVELIIMLWDLLVQYKKWGRLWSEEWGKEARTSLPFTSGKHCPILLTLVQNNIATFLQCLLVAKILKEREGDTTLHISYNAFLIDYSSPLV